MKNRAGCFALCFIFLSGLFAGSASAQDTKITVLNPRGILPPIRRIPMATRPAGLEGKTIYLVDTNYEGMGRLPLLEEMQAWFAKNMPGVKTILKLKSGSYVADDPGLWKEIAANRADGVIIGVAG